MRSGFHPGKEPGRLPQKVTMVCPGFLLWSRDWPLALEGNLDPKVTDLG